MGLEVRLFTLVKKNVKSLLWEWSHRRLAEAFRRCFAPASGQVVAHRVCDGPGEQSGLTCESLAPELGSRTHRLRRRHRVGPRFQFGEGLVNTHSKRVINKSALESARNWCKSAGEARENTYVCQAHRGARGHLKRGAQSSAPYGWTSNERHPRSCGTTGTGANRCSGRH